MATSVEKIIFFTDTPGHEVAKRTIKKKKSSSKAVFILPEALFYYQGYN